MEKLNKISKDLESVVGSLSQEDLKKPETYEELVKIFLTAFGGLVNSPAKLDIVKGQKTMVIVAVPSEFGRWAGKEFSVFEQVRGLLIRGAAWRGIRIQFELVPPES